MSTDTRLRILEAGNQAIVAKSYNGAGLSEILQSAGVPKGSFYHYFKSKEDLAVAVIEKSADDQTQRLRTRFTDRSHSPLTRLRSFFEEVRNCLGESAHRQECLISKLALELASLSEPMRAAIKCAMDQWCTVTAQCIREAQAAEEISREHDPEALANFLLASWQGVMVRRQVDGSLRPVDEYIHFVFDVLLKR